MNNDPRGRAILAACILLALLAPGFALARRPAAGPLPAGIPPVNYLPLILSERQPTAELTATATATGTQTNTPTVTNTPTDTSTPTITNTPTDTSTPTITNTPSNTPTATATIPLNTPTNTTVPTVDALATTSLQITNGTGFSLTYSIIGPTYGNGALGATQSIIIPIQTGQYTVTATTHCNTVPVGHSFTTPNVIYQLNYNCPGL